ncbi:UDP-N-acetylglucosamine 2-epimerase (non-hydrolyzing) [Amycolatopsis roodepoortensis]|uniref:non-hydrolyzing UDP-N-acetylglucosamine 2-epimerase n=1 Tax=Amycolatopsis roodepoortensis TaxID=700274 RepID=UPI00214C3D5D|nr:UDP-N-acetylglucosamine 2-epimerase (non-hydrolyzing) [Amycolatopsis roodepoortensis]UUV34738.1 UDP-N-acetylglucosamine 2-epimerase (non-hydrolyzing) [Amycolatopsis roodepoortensis]
MVWNEQGTRPRVWLVMGTRPEAIKLAPVAEAIELAGRMEPVLVATGQHPTMVDQALETFGARADVTLPLHRRDGGQPELLGQMLTGLDELAEREHPAVVVVQGDTTTTLAGTLAAFWRRIPVVHLEAGLRSFDLAAPFPEELNRRLVTQAASLHLPPTPAAAENLSRELVAAERILVTGNTSVDAIRAIADRGAVDYRDERVAAAVEAATRGEPLVLVTAHRRESWGEPLRQVLRAVAELVARHPGVRVVLPAHPNPAVRELVGAELGGVSRVVVTEPLRYDELAGALAAATLVLSDSGGIQEEAPTFGVPVLVLREVTERMEAVHAGCARLVGTDRELIVRTASELLTDPRARAAMMSNGNPFGDGKAASRTELALARLLGLTAEPVEEFAALPGGVLV